MEDNIVKKGTTTVGIMCKEGIVLAADKRACLGLSIIGDKKVDKIFKITDNMAITMAGTVSDAQLITKMLKCELNLKKIRTERDPSVKEVANLLGIIVYQNIRKFSPILGITGFLLAGRDNSGFYLYDVGPDGSILPHDDYATDGSGMVYVFGVLDTLWKKDMSVAEGIKLGTKCINAAMQRDTATGEGIDIFTITKEGVKKVLTKKVEINLEN